MLKHILANISLILTYSRWLLHIHYNIYLLILTSFSLITDGYYIYIETSGGRTGNKARLISPQVSNSTTGNKCVTFWYFMYGQNVDRLNLYVQYGLALPSSATWTKRGTQGNRWNKQTLTVTATRPFNVSFQDKAK